MIGSWIDGLARVRRAPLSRAARALALAFALAGGLPAAAGALSIEVAFTASTYQVQPTDTHADALAAHQAGALLGTSSVEVLEGIEAGVLSGGVDRDYSLAMTVRFDAAVGGDYVFQVGADWGRGGAVAVIDDTAGAVLSEQVFADDIWWANDWSNPDVITTAVTLEAGRSYTLSWVGFEGCCAGPTTVRFSHEGGAFESASSTTLAPFAIPEPALALLLGLGAALPAIARRRDPRG